MAVLDQNVFDKLSVTTLPSEQSVCDQLRSSGDPLKTSPQWLFRGQISRRPLRKWPPVDENGIKKHSIELECLLPTDYRNLEERLERGESRAGLDPIYGDRIAAIRSLVTTYLIQCHSCWNDQQVQSWYNALNGTDRAHKLLSIGQHYGLRTHELDMTSDWQVALWFATHDWTTGNYVPGGDGVIYRSNLRNLSKAETKANRDLAINIAREQFRHVDIT